MFLSSRYSRFTMDRAREIAKRYLAAQNNPDIELADLEESNRITDYLIQIIPDFCTNIFSVSSFPSDFSSPATMTRIGPPKGAMLFTSTST